MGPFGVHGKKSRPTDLSSEGRSTEFSSVQVQLGMINPLAGPGTAGSDPDILGVGSSFLKSRSKKHHAEPQQTPEM